MLDIQKLRTVRNCLTKTRWSIDDILESPEDEEKAAKYIRTMIISIEAAAGNLYETAIKLESRDTTRIGKTLEISIKITSENWLNIKVNSLLPNNRAIGSANLFSTQLKNAIAEYVKSEKLPKYERAYLAIIEHCDYKTCKSFDNDNKNLRVIPNCLKGIVFPDDSQFYLSHGVFTAYDTQAAYCDVYVLPHNDIAYFVEKHISKL